MFSEENKAIIRRYLQDALAQIRSGNPHATDEFLTSDAAFHDPGQPPSIGREAQRQRSDMLLSAFPDVQFTIEDMVAEGDKVAATSRRSFCIRLEPSGPTRPPT
jgi:predicted ester cyclase